MRLRFLEHISLLAILLAVAIGLDFSNALKRWDTLIYDSMLKLWPTHTPNDVVIVAIDEYSLKKLGRWPWSRALHAKLIDRLTDAGSKAIGVDIAFSEPDRIDPEADKLLADAMQHNGHVVLPVFPVRFDTEIRLGQPLPILRQVVNLGHVDTELDDDGLVRSIFLRAGLNNRTWPHFGLAVLQLADPEAASRIIGNRFKETTINSRVFSGESVWRRYEQITIPFIRSPEGFKRISYAKILAGKYQEELRNKIVFVGVTAAGLGGALATPVSGHHALMPGIEFDANVFENLRNGRIIEPIPHAATLSITVLIIVAVIFLYVWLRASFAPVMVLFSLTAIVVLTVSAAFVLHVWYPPATTLVTLALSYPLWSWRRLRSFVYALFWERARTEATLRSIGDGVIVTDQNTRICYMNPVAESLTGLTLEQAKKSHLDEVLKTVDVYGMPRRLLPPTYFIQCGESYAQKEVLFLKNSGQRYAVRIKTSVLHDHAKTEAGYVLTISNVTELLEMADQLQHQATHDPLTELPNRRLLFDRIEQAIASAHRTGERFAIIFLDLDDFKRVNDSLGHSSGDQLLRSVGMQLHAAMREADTVARWGGDEFVVVATNLPESNAVKEVVVKILHALARPFEVAQQEIHISASIGISLYPDDGHDVDTLIKNADIAMYRVKASQRGSFGIFSYDMNVWTIERLAFEKRLRAASAQHEFELHYQPQMNLEHSRICGVEALLRWHQKNGEWIPPSYFIPIAEDNGLIQEIGEWVIRTSFQQAQEWQRTLHTPLVVSINLSVRQIMHHGFYEHIVQSMDETGVDPTHIRFEITETMLMQDAEGCRTKLTQLKDLGFGLSIDDFGTGYASLSYLRRFPIDELKIDSSYIRHITSRQDDAVIVKAIIALARGMHLSVVAEGVEKAEQLSFLQINHCDSAQGYLISEPMPAKDLMKTIRNELLH